MSHVACSWGFVCHVCGFCAMFLFASDHMLRTPRRECPRECPRKRGCPRECPASCLRDPSCPGSGVSKKCPESVPRVSGIPNFDTLWTLSGHFLDTPEPGARRTLPATLRARRAREIPVAGRGVRNPHVLKDFYGGELFYSQLELFCLQLSLLRKPYSQA